MIQGFNDKWKNQVLSAIIAAILCLPLLIWAFLDNSIWAWDQSWYGMESVMSYLILLESPFRWLENLFTVFETRAPLIVWIGQLFVPIGLALGKIEAALLLVCIVANFISLLFIQRLAKAFQAGWTATAVSMLLLAAAPLYIGMAQQYFVESLQIVSVCYFFFLAYHSDGQHPLKTITGLAFGIAFALGVKATSPLYVLFPGLITVFNLAVATRRKKSGLSVTANDYVRFAISLFFLIMVGAWYAIHLGKLVPFIMSASSGETASLYGSKKSVMDALFFWLIQLKQALFLDWIFWIVIICSVTALATIRSKNKSIDTRSTLEDRFNRIALSALLQCFLVILVFLFQLNEETRYLFPLLPSISICVMWTASRTRLKFLPGLIALLLMVQWTILQSVSFGLLNKPANISTWLTPITTSSSAKDELVWMDTYLQHPEIKGKYIFCIVDLKDLNHVSLNFHNMGARFFRDTYLVYSLPVWAGTDWEQVAELIQSDTVKAPYVITLDKVMMHRSADPFNRTAVQVTDWLEGNKSFRRIQFPNTRGIVIYQNIDFYPQMYRPWDVQGGLENQTSLVE